MNKRILIIGIVIILIIGGILIANAISKKDKTIDTMSNQINTENKIENKEENKLNNAINSNMINNNVTEENNKDDNEKEGVDNNPYVSTNADKIGKAIEIVKKDWGEDNTVNFVYAGQNEKDEYEICVREKTTTKAIFWYYVDVDNGTFTTD